MTENWLHRIRKWSKDSVIRFLVVNNPDIEIQEESTSTSTTLPREGIHRCSGQPESDGDFWVDIAVESIKIKEKKLVQEELERQKRKTCILI
jgi:hypothetical protein